MSKVNLKDYFRTISSKQGKENLKNGYHFEHKIFLKEKRNSILTIKSSGSRGAIDIISIRSKETQHISVKRNGYISPEERRVLTNLQKKLPKGHKIYIVSEYGKSLYKAGHIGIYI